MKHFLYLHLLSARQALVKILRQPFGSLLSLLRQGDGFPRGRVSVSLTNRGNLQALERRSALDAEKFERRCLLEHGRRPVGVPWAGRREVRQPSPSGAMVLT